MKTIADTIKKFELYLDDTSELSTSEELALAQKVYDDICASNDWEVLKKEAKGITTLDSPFILLPEDFSHMALVETTNDFGKYVFLGNKALRLVNWSERRQYQGSVGFCYIDMNQRRLYFTEQPQGQEYSFDYFSIPEALKLDGFMVFPERFESILFHGMCVDGYIIQQFDKARSYADENQEKYNKKLEEMKLWNASLLNL